MISCTSYVVSWLEPFSWNLNGQYQPFPDVPWSLNTVAYKWYIWRHSYADSMKLNEELELECRHVVMDATTTLSEVLTVSGQLG